MRKHNKRRFYCEKCRLWFFFVYGKHPNNGNCTICGTKGIEKMSNVQKESP